jgi:hypothetical protein
MGYIKREVLYILINSIARFNADKVLEIGWMIKYKRNYLIQNNFFYCSSFHIILKFNHDHAYETVVFQ